MLNHKRKTLKNNNSILIAFYDFATCPTTYDFLNFLCMANAVRKAKNCSSFFVIFVPGHYNGFRSKTHLSDEEKEYRVNNILTPSTHLHPFCSGFYKCKNRNEARNFLTLEEHCIFPEGYTTTFPIGIYSWKATWSLINCGHDVQTLSAPSIAKDEAKKWLELNIGDKKPVVITLRNSKYQRERNSNKVAWLEFANYLSQNNYCAVIIPDHETLYSAQKDFSENIVFCRPASWNIGFRAALYETCYLSMFVNNGPWLLGVLNPNVNFIAIKIITEKYGVTSNTWMIENGFTPDKNPSFLKPYQKFIWQDDTPENLVSAFLDATKNIEIARNRTEISHS